jgi:hypothetical protein
VTDSTQHSLPEVPDAAVEAIRSAKMPMAEKRNPLLYERIGNEARRDLKRALPSLHAAWEKERGAKESGVCPVCEGHGGGDDDSECIDSTDCEGCCPRCWCSGCHDGQDFPESRLAELDDGNPCGSWLAYQLVQAATPEPEIDDPDSNGVTAIDRAVVDEMAPESEEVDWPGVIYALRDKRDSPGEWPDSGRVRSEQSMREHEEAGHSVRRYFPAPSIPLGDREDAYDDLRIAVLSFLDGYPTNKFLAEKKLRELASIPIEQGSGEARTEYRVVTESEGGFKGFSNPPQPDLAVAIECRDYFPKGSARIQSRTVTETEWTDLPPAASPPIEQGEDR